MSATQQIKERVTVYRTFRVVETEHGSFNVPAINCFGASCAKHAHEAIDAYITRNEWRRSVHYKARDFNEVHQNASEIVVDTETGLPYKAVYGGPLRSVPDVYYFADHWGGACNE